MIAVMKHSDLDHCRTVPSARILRHEPRNDAPIEHYYWQQVSYQNLPIECVLDRREEHCLV